MHRHYHARVQLFIIRHAKAEDRNVETWPDDTARPLTRVGAREFERVAKRLRRWQPEVDLVLASGWTRAWQTAAILRARAKWPKPAQTKLLETTDPASIPGILQFLAEQPQQAKLALVGHEPVLGMLVTQLCGSGGVAVVMRKGAVAWLEGDPGSMALAGLLVPAMLRPRQ